MPSPLLLLFLVLLGVCDVTTTAAEGGTWNILKKSIGISSMHMQLMNTDRVVMYDRTDTGPSNISLAKGKCKRNKKDCTAHSVEYDVVANTIRPLTVLTDVWCSSGSLSPDGRLIQTGGYNSGERRVRIYRPCNGCDWEEIPNGLVRRRWYATNHILPDGRQIIVGGRRQFTYEFYPKMGRAVKAYYLRFLAETREGKIENNLYPFVFLVPDGNLFVFANNRAILFDYKKGAVVKRYPQLPDGNPRNYPSTGSAVLLPLSNLDSGAVTVEILVCGGAPKGSFNKARRGIFVKALDTCARMKFTDPTPHWHFETMPYPRVMGDMIILPNGNILIINGGANGTAGFEWGRNPVLHPLIYKPANKIGSRFEVQNPSTIPRMYHSTAILARDGRILVSGSNPHNRYRFTRVILPTELSLESFSPPYLGKEFANIRPDIILPNSPAKVGYGLVVPVRFTTSGVMNFNLVKVTMVAPSFNTHSFSMNQRLLVLKSGNVTKIRRSIYEIRVTMPRTGNLAPSGYYMLFVVHQDIPSKGIWIHIE